MTVGVETRTEDRLAIRWRGKLAEMRGDEASARETGWRLLLTDTLCREAGAIQYPRGEIARPVSSAGFYPPGTRRTLVMAVESQTEE